jgi:hypothetical protein
LCFCSYDFSSLRQLKPLRRRAAVATKSACAESDGRATSPPPIRHRERRQGRGDPGVPMKLHRGSPSHLEDCHGTACLAMTTGVGRREPRQGRGDLQSPTNLYRNPQPYLGDCHGRPRLAMMDDVVIGWRLDSTSPLVWISAAEEVDHRLSGKWKTMRRFLVDPPSHSQRLPPSQLPEDEKIARLGPPCSSPYRVRDTREALAIAWVV